MDGKKVAIWIGVAIALVLVGFLVFRPAGDTGVIDVDAQRMQELVDEGVRVVDVRTEGEYQAGHIPGAELVGMNEIQAAAQGWNTSEPIAIYCATGSRSIDVVNYLAEQGFETVYHYASGIVTWEGEIERGAAVATADPVETETSGIPVMYEFYTDS
jgi:rhodanese-related sulfurtransferase